MTFLARHKPLLLICLALAWFNWGIEDFRAGRLGDLRERPWTLFVPPWKPLRAYVSRNGDEKLYREYAKLFFGGEADLDYLAEKRRGDHAADRAQIASQIRPGSELRMPYRDFPFEYPPVPLALMLLPALVVDSLPAYRVVYGILAGLILLGAGALGVGAFATDRRRAWVQLGWVVLALGPIVVGRFDALPAVLVALALFGLTRGRPFSSGLALGAATLSKLYPLLLLPVWGALLFRAGKKGAAVSLALGTGVAAALISAPFLALAPQAFLASSFVYGKRPFQIESLPGALIAWVGGRSGVVENFGSYNVLTPGWVDAFYGAVLPLGILLLACLAWRRSRGHELAHDLLLWTTAALCFVLCASKVLSPQFLIWLVPFVAVHPDRSVRARALWTCAITQLYYPHLYGFFVEDGSRLAGTLVLARNFVLVALAVAAFRAAWESQPTKVS